MGVRGVAILGMGLGSSVNARYAVVKLSERTRKISGLPRRSVLAKPKLLTILVELSSNTAAASPILPSLIIGTRVSRYF